MTPTRREPGRAQRAARTGRGVLPCLLLACFPACATAQQEAPDESDPSFVGPRLDFNPIRSTRQRIERLFSDEQVLFELSPDSVSSRLEEVRTDKPGLFRYGPITLAESVWQPARDRVKEEIGLELGFNVTALYMRATPGRGTREGSALDLDFFGQWALINRGQKNTGQLVFATEWRTKLSSLTPSALGAEIGSLWGVTNAFNERDFRFVEAAWYQDLFDDRVQIRGGLLRPTDQFARGRLRSDSQYFLNEAFSGQPTMSHPSFAPGADVRVRVSDSFYAAGGLYSSESGAATDGFRTLFGAEAKLFTAWEIGYTPTPENAGPGAYRLTYWHTDGSTVSGVPSGNGVVLSLDQDLGNGVILFARYGYGDGAGLIARHVAGVGAGFDLDRGDFAGIAYAWGEPTVELLRQQHTIEAFYRFQITPLIQVTPDAQLIIHPSNAPEDDVIGVLGVRVRVVF